MSALIYAQDFEELAFEYFLRAKADGVMHAEVFFDPQAHTERGILYTTVRQGFTNACKKAENQLGITTKLILCFLRHLPVAEAQAPFNEAKEDLMSGTLGGIGLDSSEKGNPPSAWREIYANAKISKIRRTAHAGEEGPVDYIREAMRELDVERIDHGFRLAEVNIPDLKKSEFFILLTLVVFTGQGADARSRREKVASDPMPFVKRETTMCKRSGGTSYQDIPGSWCQILDQLRRSGLFRRLHPR